MSKFFIHLLKDPKNYRVVVTKGSTYQRGDLVEGPYSFDRPADREQMVRQVHDLGNFYRRHGSVNIVSHE